MCIRDRYYVDGNGKLVKGAQVINGNHYYFNNDYSQVKGAWANGRYYDGDSGQAVTNRFVQVLSLIHISRLPSLKKLQKISWQETSIQLLRTKNG